MTESTLKREKLISLFRKKLVFLPQDEPKTSVIRVKQDKSPIIPHDIKKEKSEIEDMFYFEYGDLLQLYTLLYELRLTMTRVANIPKNCWSI